MIGIIGAMSTEVDGLRAMLSDRKDRKICGIKFSRGKLSGADVVIAQSGVGKVMASMCAAAMCFRFRPSLLINTGVAGAVDPTLRIGDIVVSEGAAQHDFDTSAIDGTPKGWNQALGTVVVKADEAAASVLIKTALKEGLSAKPGIVVSGDQFISDNEKKAELADVFGASVCEMEGAAIAAVAAFNRVPFVILRAVSDGADADALMDFPAFCELAAGNSIKVLSSAVPELSEHYK
ncbi:MAG: 5'-methylthioadenosine/adenosylhomocysteine nucleosidase [Clostridia bacterium]|nr:5'-methylthioadenosine/adenosylhomocysteine nucleosidase [Clostridia bacterium]